MTPPDSGEREVRKFPADADGVCRTKYALIPQDLAQRILAALEESLEGECIALASELLAAVERKP